MLIGHITRKLAVTVPEDATIHEVAQSMNDSAVGAVVVTRGNSPVGIITDRDLVVRVLSRWIEHSKKAKDVMTTNLVTLDADADAHQALAPFEHYAIRRLPLVQQGNLVGMITVDDLLIDLVAALGSLTRPATGQTIFGSPEPEPQFAE